MSAKIGAILLSAGLLCLSAPLAQAGAPDFVTVDGEWELDRREHHPCQIAVPPVISGDIHIEADFESGTVEGWFIGSGAGNYTLPAECETASPTEYDLTHLETWTAELSNIDGQFGGSFNKETGEFELEADISVDSAGERSAPGRQYICATVDTDDWVSICPLVEVATEQTATISGIIQPTGINEGEIDWYTAYCGRATPEGDSGHTFSWGRDGCPTFGVWDAEVTEVVWGENAAPEVGGIAASPADPSSEDTVVFSVEATDADGDELIYTWFIDGVQDAATGSAVNWATPPGGDHTIKVTVSDGIDDTDAFLDIRVSEHVGAGDRDDDGTPDDEDLCPDEWGLEDDGCPPFAVILACSPTEPSPGDAMSCTADVRGVHSGERVQYEWYLDNGSVASGIAAWTWESATEGLHDVGIDVLGEGRSARADLVVEVTVPPPTDEEAEQIPPEDQAAAAIGSLLLAGAWLTLERIIALRDAGVISGEEAAALADQIGVTPTDAAPTEAQVEVDLEDDETPEEMVARRQATWKRDIDEFMEKHPEYRRIYDKLFNKDGTVNQWVLTDMMDHYEKYGPNTEYAKQFAEEEEALRRFTDAFFENHIRLWEYQDKVERPDGTIDRALLRKLVIWQRKYGDPEPKESPWAWVADGLTGTMREVFTGMEEDGTTSWTSMVLRGLVGFATAGQSEWIYVPGDSMFRLKAGVDRGEEGIELYGKVAAGVVVDELIGRGIGKGIEKGVGAAAKKWPGLAKKVGQFIEDASEKLKRPVFGGTKPAPLSAEMTAFKRQVVEAIDSGDDAAMRRLFKSKGMKQLAQLEAGGHLTPQQAGKLVGFHDDLTRAAVRRGTADAIDEVGKVHGVKPKEVMVGNSGSVGPHRSVLTDADRTVVATFSDDALTAHARASNQYRFDVAPDGTTHAIPDKGWAATDLQGKLTKLHTKHVELNLNGAEDVVTLHARKTGKSLGEALEDLRGKGVDVDAGAPTRLNAADMDTASYSGFGSKAGPGDSYPSGFTQSRQAIQGEADVYRVGSDGSVAKPYKTSGQAIIDQNALNKVRYSGDLPADPTRIGIGEMRPLLEQQKIAVGKYTDPKSIGKAIDRANYVANRTGVPLPDRNLVNAAAQIRATPTATDTILKNHGLTEGQFIKGCKDMMSGYNPKLN